MKKFYFWLKDNWSGNVLKFYQFDNAYKHAINSMGATTIYDQDNLRVCRIDGNLHYA